MSAAPYRIGSAQGFYGDDVMRALPMIEGGHVDVVCFEALSELTLAILQKDKLANPERGYTFDLNIIARQVLPAAFARKIPLITSGGGLNPLAAAQMVREAAAQIGLTGLKIAAVTGDDVLDQLSALLAADNAFVNLETGQRLADVDLASFVTANVYLGAAPIVEALQQGADIVITGRVADPCLYLAPLIAHFGWGWEDWDQLACGIVAGHLLECTGQVVGGNSLALIDALEGDQLAELGYPIAEVEADGAFVITRTPGTAGVVTLETVKEQLLYEIHDPRFYITPDVLVNFTTLQLEDVGENRVRVSGATGRPRPVKLKLNLGRLEGYTRELVFTIGAPRAWRKVDQLKAMIAASWRDLPIERIEYSYLGLNSLSGASAPLPPDPAEVVVRVVFAAAEADVLRSATRRLMALGLSGPAGMGVLGTSVAAEPRAVIGLWPALINRDAVTHHVHPLEVTP